MILNDRMKLHTLLVKLSQMGSIFKEIFDVKVLNVIYPHGIYIYQGNTVQYKILKFAKRRPLILYLEVNLSYL